MRFKFGNQIGRVYVLFFEDYRSVFEPFCIRLNAKQSNIYVTAVIHKEVTQQLLNNILRFFAWLILIL
jgi:hypothetical protein